MNESAKVLLTGFEPFAGDSINPSWEVARALSGARVGDASIVAAQLPCVFGSALQVLDRLLAEHRPSLVLAMGLAGGRVGLSLERVAINVDDARIADNAGAQPVDLPVVAEAPAAYFSTLPIKAMAAAMRQAGYPASISQTAGSFVCNHLFFGLQHRLHASAVRSGFLHLPWLPQQAALLEGQPSMPLETMVAAVRVALEVALVTHTDIRQGGGALA
jgi:pyroglutamyl-peptidase